MLMMLGIILLAGGAYVGLRGYERNLARKTGPWISTVLGTEPAPDRKLR
jgi:glycerol uptake facilitator-like aquaporin